MIHEKDMLAYFMSPRGSRWHNTREILAAGERLPGCDVCFVKTLCCLAASNMQLPWASEYDFVASIKGRLPFAVIIDDVTGLPNGKAAETPVVACTTNDKESRLEGLFGSGRVIMLLNPFKRPLIHVKKVYHSETIL